ncbi:MAG: hypothetical protein EBU90_30475, partial [Proteobacteria bacterium]|nr:hypothetical protein [Pseudomonadota bacterium]
MQSAGDGGRSADAVGGGGYTTVNVDGEGGEAVGARSYTGSSRHDASVSRLDAGEHRNVCRACFRTTTGIDCDSGSVSVNGDAGSITVDGDTGDVTENSLVGGTTRRTGLVSSNTVISPTVSSGTQAEVVVVTGVG